jgi:hypothetical protein
MGARREAVRLAAVFLMTPPNTSHTRMFRTSAPRLGRQTQRTW